MALDTKIFVKSLIREGYTHVCVVPCSFAKYVINEVINNKKIEYIPCASEAVVCSVAAGLKMSGKKPIAIIQSSGLTNMGSCITSLLKPYEVTFPILTSWRTYSAGDSEIQHQHLSTELPILINSYGYEHVILDSENIDNAVSQINGCDKTNTICVMKKGCFTGVALEEEHELDLSYFVPRSKFLTAMNELYKDTNTIFIGTTGNTAREMYSFMPDTNNFYMAGNMGGALSLGLGAAIAGKKVVVCGGDAEFVMHMGGLTTAGRYGGDVELTYVLFDNESNKSTGGQNTYQKHVDYLAIAKASGFEIPDDTVTSLEGFSSCMTELELKKNLKLIHVKCGIDDETPRPPLEVVKRNEFK